MADFSLLHRAALAGAKSGSFGPTQADGGITLEALPEGHVLQVLASPDAGDLAASIASVSDGSVYAVRAVGPGQWFVVGDAGLSASEFAKTQAALSGRASIADQTHGRIRIGISGAGGEAVLAKGTAVDMHPDQFPVGRSTMTLIGHITAMITRTAADRFEILVLRGFAESLWDELIEMGLEFGVDARTAP